jgi:hypothetical protein
METTLITEMEPLKIWYDKDIFGTVNIFMQHRGCNPFVIVNIHYDHLYTDNVHQHKLTKEIGKLLGVEDIPHRPRM